MAVKTVFEGDPARAAPGAGAPPRRSPAREDRLAAALRANLRRRKAPKAAEASRPPAGPGREGG